MSDKEPLQKALSDYEKAAKEKEKRLAKAIENVQKIHREKTGTPSRPD